MAERYIKLFTDCLETWEALTDDEWGRLTKALLTYKRSGEIPDMTGNERIIFPVYRAQVDRENENYSKQCEVNCGNGKKGGRPKSEQNRKNPVGFSESEQNRKNPVGFSESEKSQDKDKDKDKDNPPIPPKGQTVFEKFWSAYPKKVGKKAAKKAFDRANAPVESLLAAIEQQKCGDQWSRENGRYIPNPATWLNQGRWEDEVVAQKEANPYGDIEL